MSDPITITILTLSSIQFVVYLIMLIMSLYKLGLASKVRNGFMQILYIFTLIYIIVQLIIQSYQIITIILGNTATDNSNMVLSLNIICMIMDVYILVLLTFYWKLIQGSFIDTITDRVNTGVCIRFSPILCWSVCYLAYFGYLLGNSIVDNNQPINSTNQICLYIVAQCISAFMLIVYSIWQSYHWCKLQSTIQQFQRVIPLTMNKTRFKAIFWITTGFNSIRTIFICYLIISAYNQQYDNLIIALNCFTLTAVLSLGFYLFGFKIEVKGKDKDNTIDFIRRDTGTSRKTSSAHQTQLSHRSQRDKDQYQIKK